MHRSKNFWPPCSHLPDHSHTRSKNVAKIFKLGWRISTWMSNGCHTILRLESRIVDCILAYAQDSHTVSTTIFHTFSMRNEKTLTPSLIFIYPKFYSWNKMQKNFANLSSAVTNKIWINKWLNLEFPYFFNTLCTFWSNSILFQGFQNGFDNSILFQYRVGTLYAPMKSHKKENTVNVFQLLTDPICWKMKQNGFLLKKVVEPWATRTGIKLQHETSTSVATQSTQAFSPWMLSNHSITPL